jgi:putative transposase
MARKKVILTDEYPYHITNRSNNRERFYLPLKELWPICINAIKTLKKDYGCRHHAFVLMPNHYHLVLDTPKLNLSDSIQYFQTEVARRANKKTGRINHFFGGRYKWSLITNETYYWNAFKYIARNPVAAGICKNIEDYPYCSINDPSSKELWAPLSEIENRVDYKWLNEDFSKEKKEAIKKGLRRSVFKPPSNNNKYATKLDLVPEEIKSRISDTKSSFPKNRFQCNTRNNKLS